MPMHGICEPVGNKLVAFSESSSIAEESNSVDGAIADLGRDVELEAGVHIAT